MRITSKGQVTIPQAIRDETGLLPHTEVEFEMQGRKVILKPAGRPTPRSEQALARLRGSLKHVRMTTEELMALTRGED